MYKSKQCILINKTSSKSHELDLRGASNPKGLMLQLTRFAEKSPYHTRTVIAKTIKRSVVVIAMLTKTLIFYSKWKRFMTQFSIKPNNMMLQKCLKFPRCSLHDFNFMKAV